MRGLPTLIRLNRWRLDEKRRRYTELERSKDDLLAQRARLAAELEAERAVAGASIEASRTYPAYYRNMVSRRDRLADAVGDIQRRLEAAAEEITVAFGELKKFETVQTNLERRQQAEIARKEQILLDEIGIEVFRRSGKG